MGCVTRIGGRVLRLIAVVALAMAASLLLAAAASARAYDFTSGWIASADPCHPVKREKQYLLETYKVKADYITCLPVKVTVTWDVEETYRHHGRYGTDRAKILLEEKFEAYLRIVGHQKDPSRVRSFGLYGPAPCCPGGIEAKLLQAHANVLVCDRWGEECTRWESDGTALQFKVVPEDDSVLGFQWSAEGDSIEGQIDSSNVYLHEGAIKRPWFQRAGILETVKGSSFTVTAKGPASFTWADIEQGMEQGYVTKVFPLTVNEPMLVGNELHRIQGQVTVKLELEEQKEERWLVTVTAWEKADMAPFIEVRPPGKKAIKLKVWTEFEYALQGVFVIKRSKKNWSYKSGEVTKASLIKKVMLPRWDLYSCHVPKCKKKPAKQIGDMVGALILGKRSGAGVKLAWPKFRAEACVLCMPQRAYMKKKIYRHRFGTGELMGYLSREVLPLKNGYTRKGKVKDWLRYRITLKKLK